MDSDTSGSYITDISFEVVDSPLSNPEVQYIEISDDEETSSYGTDSIPNYSTYPLEGFKFTNRDSKSSEIHSSDNRGESIYEAYNLFSHVHADQSRSVTSIHDSNNNFLNYSGRIKGNSTHSNNHGTGTALNETKAVANLEEIHTSDDVNSQISPKLKYLSNPVAQHICLDEIKAFWHNKEVNDEMTNFSDIQNFPLKYDVIGEMKPANTEDCLQSFSNVSKIDTQSAEESKTDSMEEGTTAKLFAISEYSVGLNKGIHESWEHIDEHPEIKVEMWENVNEEVEENHRFPCYNCGETLTNFDGHNCTEKFIHKKPKAILSKMISDKQHKSKRSKSKKHQKSNNILCCNRNKKVPSDKLSCNSLKGEIKIEKPASDSIDLAKYYGISSTKVRKEGTNKCNTGSQKCNFCFKLYKSRNSLKSHLKRHHDNNNNNQNEFICDYCFKSFAKKVTLKTHMQCCSANKDQQTSPYKYSCDLCGKSYKSKFERKIHMDVKHSQGPTKTTWYKARNSKAYLCKICDEHIYDFPILKKHIREHLGISGPYICEHCQQGFQLKAVLRKHVIRKHTTEKPFQCLQCKKFFKMKPYLNRHIKLWHNQNSASKDYSCQLCQRLFDTKENLQRHCDEFTFNCDICIKHFKTKFALNRHVKNVHEGKKIECELKCGKTFAMKSSMKRHIELIHNK